MKIPDFIVNMIGRTVAKKLDLQEGQMEEGKKWYKSKTVIAGILTVLIGAYETTRMSVAPSFGWNLPEIPPVVYTLLGAMGVWGRVTATAAIKS